MNKWYMHKTEGDAQNSAGFWDTNGLPILGQTTKPGDSQQTKENLSNSELYRPGKPYSKNKRNRKETI